MTKPFTVCMFSCYVIRVQYIVFYAWLENDILCRYSFEYIDSMFSV